MVEDDVRDAIQSAFSSVVPTERLRERALAIRTARRRRGMASAGVLGVVILVTSVALVPRVDDRDEPILTGEPASSVTPVWPEFALGLDGPAQQTPSGDWRSDADTVAIRFAEDVLQLSSPELTPVSAAAHSAVVSVTSPSFAKPVILTLATPDGGRVWSVATANTLAPGTRVDLFVGPDIRENGTTAVDLKVTPQPEWARAKFWNYRGQTTGGTETEPPANSFGLGFGPSPDREPGRPSAVWLNFLNPEAELTDFVALGVPSDDHSVHYVVSDDGALTSSAEVSQTRYGFPPLTPLLDAKPEPVEETTVHEADGIRMTFWLTAEGFGLANHAPDGSGSMSGESMYATALSYMVTSERRVQPHTVVTGLTRSEVASVEWDVEGESITVDTFSHPAFPRVRFFYIPLDGSVDYTAGVVRAFAEDGSLLTDTNRIRDEDEAFRQAMHDRAGVEVVHGRLITYAGYDAGMSLTLSVRACGTNPQPRWTEAADVIRIRIELVRPRGAGDCTTGAVSEAHIGLNEPIGSRAIVDDATGEPVQGH